MAWSCINMSLIWIAPLLPLVTSGLDPCEAAARSGPPALRFLPLTALGAEKHPAKGMDRPRPRPYDLCKVNHVGMVAVAALDLEDREVVMESVCHRR
jgi:hypothetical protein